MGEVNAQTHLGLADKRLQVACGARNASTEHALLQLAQTHALISIAASLSEITELLKAQASQQPASTNSD